MAKERNVYLVLFPCIPIRKGGLVQAAGYSSSSTTASMVIRQHFEVITAISIGGFKVVGLCSDYGPPNAAAQRLKTHLCQVNVFILKNFIFFLKSFYLCVVMHVRVSTFPVYILILIFYLLIHYTLNQLSIKNFNINFIHHIT